MNKLLKRAVLYAAVVFSIFLILFIITFLYSRPWKNALFIKPVYQIDTDEKLAALTFDDGPSESITPLLLDLLDKHSVKATFFMLGKNIENMPDIAEAVYEKGHLIGNHSYDHPRLVFKSVSYISKQISETDKLIESAGQKEVKYFRPPYSAKYIALPLILHSSGKILVTGTYDPPSEYKMPFDAETVADEVINNINPGSVIYLHDGKNVDPEQFIKSVDMIITGLKKQGYNFVRLDYRH